MSAIRRYPKVQNTPTTVSPQQKGVNSSSQALKNIAQSLSSAAQAIYKQVTQSVEGSTSTVVSSVLGSRPTAQSLQQQALQLAQESRLPSVEAAQVAGLVAANAYVTTQPQSVQNAWQPLQNAGSSEAAKTALANFTKQLETQHQQVIVDNLVVACTKAALKVGFTTLEATTTVVNGTVRLISSDETGRSLVTEISTNPDADVPLATEIIGSSDESCEAILDGFEAALAQEGVTTAPPERQFTGGVCELAAAKEFVRQRPTRQRSTQGKSGSKKVTRSASMQQQMKQG